MKYFLLFALILTQTACDTYWRVQRERPLQHGEDACIRNAIRITEGVEDVIRIRVGKSYSVTLKELPKPAIFRFKTSLADGYVQYIDDTVSAYFSDIGHAPVEIKEQGPAYLDAILNTIESSCNVVRDGSKTTSD